MSRPELAIWKYSKKCGKNDNNKLSARQHAQKRKLTSKEAEGRKPGKCLSFKDF